jgi:hypothetical protein
MTTPAVRRRRSLALTMALIALVASGCGFNRPDPTQLGVRRLGLDLAYSDDSLKVKVPPQVIVKYVPAPPGSISALVPGAAAYLPPSNPAIAAPTPTCPKAPPGALPAQVAEVAITRPPVAGTYLQHNVGTIKVSGTVPLTFPYPSMSRVIIKDVRAVDTTDEVGTKTHQTTFTLEDEILPTYRIVSSYAYDTKQLNLVSRTVISGKASTSFRPAPPVEVVAFTGPGSSWDSAGVDTDTYTTLAVQGSIGKPEPVDVCGQLIDTQRISTDENQVDVADGTQSGTRSGQPAITNYALQLGGLPLRREQHTSQVVKTDNGPVTFTTDVVSTLMTVHPAPAGKT